MTPTTSAGLVGGVVGAFLGSVPGWLVGKGLGAAIGAVAGGAALAAVGVATASPSSPTPAPGASGLPRGMGLPQLSPRGLGISEAAMASVRAEALSRGPGTHIIRMPQTDPGPTIMPCISCTVDGKGHIQCSPCDVAPSGSGTRSV
jgi:hypothetical protein